MNQIIDYNQTTLHFIFQDVDVWAFKRSYFKCSAQALNWKRKDIVVPLGNFAFNRTYLGWSRMSGRSWTEITILIYSYIQCSVWWSFFGLIDSVNFSVNFSDTFRFLVNFIVMFRLWINWSFFPSNLFYFSERLGIVYWKECFFFCNIIL